MMHEYSSVIKFHEMQILVVLVGPLFAYTRRCCTWVANNSRRSTISTIGYWTHFCNPNNHVRQSNYPHTFMNMKILLSIYTISQRNIRVKTHFDACYIRKASFHYLKRCLFGNKSNVIFIFFWKYVWRGSINKNIII